MHYLFESACAIFHLPASERGRLLRIWDRLEERNAPHMARAQLGRYSRFEWNRLTTGEVGALFETPKDAAEVWFR